MTEQAVQGPEGQIPDAVLDASGLACPLPLLKAKQALHALTAGQILYVVATDPGSARDIPAFCRLAGHNLLATVETGQQWRFWLQKH